MYVYVQRKIYVQFINKKTPLCFNCAIEICYCGRRGSLPVLSTVVFVTFVTSSKLHCNFSLFCVSSGSRNTSFKQTLFKLTALFENIAVPRFGFFMSTLSARLFDGDFTGTSSLSGCACDDIMLHAFPRIITLFNMRRATSIR